MTEAQYKELLPHKLLLDASYDCIDKHLPLPGIPKQIVDRLVDIYDETSLSRPTDRHCGACVTSSISETIKRFKAYEDTARK